ncbi:MAG: M28 family peptidase [Actinomycetota bacterium]|nr:M28 family peptidase [Actinomycetota bacterium]
MDRLTGALAFFDIGNTLASVTISSSGDRIEKLAVYPYVPGVLGELRDRGARLGVISNRGPLPAADVNQALEAAGLWTFFEPELLIYSPKDSPRIFEQVAAQAGTPDRLLFVGEDPGERSQALQAGFLVAPHPQLALAVLGQQAPLRYVRITVPGVHAGEDWRAQLRDLPLLPLHVSGEAGATVYAIATTAAAARLDDLGFWVDRLGTEDEPLTTDLYLLRDDRQFGSGFLTLDGNSTDFFEAGPASRSVLASTEEGLFVAVAAGGSVESYHFSGAQHGHNLKLVPSAALIENFDGGAGLAEARLAAVAITPAEKEILDSRIQPQHLAGHVERYAGAQPAGSNGVVIKSRHIHHADNAAAVTTLVADLERIGAGRFAVHRHRFTHEGRPLDNVEAELPGNGLDGVVLVTAHMDSTAARQAGYQPAVDLAPGADDDASGVAGVLAAADAIGALDATQRAPRRTIRFVLFNAEEHGLVGSNAYARDQAVLGTPIVAVLQMDMIGYDVLPGRTFELHAGFTPSSAVEARSLALAQMIAELVPQVSPALPAPQIYPVSGESDPAERRSDHYSFQLQGYTACLASEDLFAGPGSGAPPAEMNPNYHLPTDVVINAGYAADIARLVTAAAWIAATQ